MSRKNKFGFDSIDDIPVGIAPRRRGTGPMSTAVRETAENLQEATEAKVEIRQKNAADAKEYRAAQRAGRVLEQIPLGEIATDSLPRDRLDLAGVARTDEMEELKSSIRAHGQKEPIEVFADTGGALQLKKGWRRLTALRQLHEETGDERFATAMARVDRTQAERLKLYVDMVEENILREDLTFAEMARVAIHAAEDKIIDGEVADDMVNRLYASLHKMKRSYIRSFVALLRMLGEDLKFPKSVSRNLGVDVARALRSDSAAVVPLRRRLSACATPEEQEEVLKAALAPGGTAAPLRAQKAQREKFEFHIGGAKVTARKGELRIKEPEDFTEIPRDRLEQAIAAFRRVLRDG
ncbi:MAG: ParB N-terminal domain-containing protein [Pseudomonadota bacterium]